MNVVLHLRTLQVDAGTIVLSVQNFLAPEQKQQKK